MKKDAYQAPPCDSEVFNKGYGICSFSARTFITEPWVVRVRELSGQRVDWHMSGGMSSVLYIGDYTKVRAAVEDLYPDLVKACKDNGYDSGPELFQIYGPEADGLYRRIDHLPDDVVAVVTSS
jgi:hypothetical protein